MHIIWIHIETDEHEFIDRVAWMGEYTCRFSTVVGIGFIVQLIKRDQLNETNGTETKTTAGEEA